MYADDGDVDFIINVIMYSSKTFMWAVSMNRAAF
jgi:hypothetical protein